MSSRKDGVDNDDVDNDGEDRGSGGNGGRGRGTSSSDVDYGGDDSYYRGIGEGDDDQTTLSTMAAVAAKMVEAATTAVLAVAMRTASAEDVLIWVAYYVLETAGDLGGMLCVGDGECVIDGTEDENDIVGDSYVDNDGGSRDGDGVEKPQCCVI